MLWELMKAQRTGVYPDLRTKYIAEAFKNTSSKITEMSGALPLAFVTTGLPLTNYKAYGNAVQAATPSTDNPVEVQAVGERTRNLWKTFSSKVSCGVTITHDGEKYLFSGTCNESVNVSLVIKLNAGTYSLQANANKIPVENSYSCIDVWIPSLNKLYNIKNEVATYKTTTFSIDAPMESSLRIRLEKGVNYDGFELKPMLNEGETALPYEPYGYKIPFTTAAEDGSESITTTVYLDKPLYKIGDYADTLSYAEQKVDRVIKEMILTGDENWQYNNTLSTSNAFYILLSNYVRADGFCSHYSTVADSRANEGIYFGVNINILTNLSDGLSTIDDFKAYLAAQYAAGTPVKVWYVLQTPESESVELPKLPTLDGVTVIDAATEIKPSAMDIKYTEQRLMMFARRE